MAHPSRLLIRLLSPLLYVAAAYGAFLLADAMARYIRVIQPGVYESLATRSWGVIALFVSVGLLVLGLVTVLLLKLERQAQPSIRDHLRQSALWYAFGILHWSALVEYSEPGTMMDLLVGLLPITAVLANGLVMGAVRVRGR